MKTALIVIGLVVLGAGVAYVAIDPPQFRREIHYDKKDAPAFRRMPPLFLRSNC